MKRSWYCKTHCSTLRSTWYFLFVLCAQPKSDGFADQLFGRMAGQDHRQSQCSFTIATTLSHCLFSMHHIHHFHLHSPRSHPSPPLHDSPPHPPLQSTIKFIPTPSLHYVPHPIPPPCPHPIVYCEPHPIPTPTVCSYEGRTSGITSARSCQGLSHSQFVQ